MKKICIFDTATGSLNIGDQIIMESFQKEMTDIVSQGFCLRLPTHNPICHSYQDFKRNPMIKYLEECDLKFIGGTNILLKNMLLPLTQWNINLWNCKGYKNTILVGCGLNPNKKKINLYTKMLYKKILAKNYIHSVRDDATKEFLESLGFKAINTGCPTLWSINQKFCKQIPTKKANQVVFTLTDYLKDKEKDQEIINILNKNYKRIYYFPQGSEDLEYLQQFENIEKIEVLSANLESFEKKLIEGNIDYVGTRLHAGIYAIKHKIRSIIIIIDNRARDISKVNHLKCVERTKIDKLSDMINNELITDIKIDQYKIKMFKKQFEDVI